MRSFVSMIQINMSLYKTTKKIELVKSYDCGVFTKGEERPLCGLKKYFIQVGVDLGELLILHYRTNLFS